VVTLDQPRAMWELVATGYANLMTLGIRRLVDTNPRTDFSLEPHLRRSKSGRNRSGARTSCAMTDCHSTALQRFKSTSARRILTHAKRIAEGFEAVAMVTYNTIDTALENIVRGANFLSTNFFNDAAFGSIVPVPQFILLEALDQPWAKPENLPALHEHWQKLSETMDQWAYNTDARILAAKPLRAVCRVNPAAPHGMRITPRVLARNSPESGCPL
jgi:hypothetical protein